MLSVLSSSIRLLILVLAGLTVLAIGLGRVNHSKFQHRRLTQDSLVSVSHFLMPPPRNFDELCVLDPNLGQLQWMPLPSGDRLDLASVSPWQDAGGESQVVGRWMHRVGGDANGLCDGIGLARYAYPSGRVLDQIPTSITPVANPCWYPGTEARVLFPAGDGQLYSFAFEPGPDDPLRMGERVPVEVPWRIEPPGEGRVMILDLCWPSDPEFKGRVLATLTVQQTRKGRLTFSENQLWSLQLDGTGTSIIAADPLHRSDRIAASLHRRRPTLGRTSEGRLLLAYLGQPPGSSRNDLFVTPVQFNPETETPWVDPDQERLVLEDCVLIPPAFTTDGHWIIGLGKEDRNGVAVLCARVGAPTSALAALAPLTRPSEDPGRKHWRDEPLDSIPFPY